jgi:hypothetical protein
VFLTKVLPLPGLEIVQPVGAKVAFSNPSVSGSAAPEVVTVITTSEVEAVQGELLIVHLKVLAPLLKPLTVEVGLLVLEKLPVPLTTDQAPVPIVAVLAASVAVVAHMLWEDPELAVVGDWLSEIVRLLLVPLPQVLVGITVILPAVEPKLTVMLLVFVPAVIEAPVGTVQV